MSPTIKDLLGFVVNPPPGDPTLTAQSDLLPSTAVISSPAASGQVPVANGLGGYTWQAPAGGPPTGAASGDLSGSYPGPTVAKVNGVAVPLTGSAWIVPTLTNSWANVGSGLETAGYLKDPIGFVHVRGVVIGGSNATVAFTLPAGYRPGLLTQSIAMLGSLAAGGGVEVATSGTVTLFTTGSSVSVSMSCIFLAEN